MAVKRPSAVRGDVDRSFEELYRGHRADVFRAALRELGNVHDAEDVTQATFVDAYRAVLRGSEPESPRAWLLAIAENVRRRRYRTAQRRPREQPTDADFPLTAELSHDPGRALAAALGELPAEQRRAFALRELAGRSYEEIAAETGSTVGAIQMQLFRARQSLRERLEPPQVQRRRRTGLVVPVPGWLTTLVSRADVALLTPRAAGAAGAAVLAIAGTTVAVQEVEAGAPGAPAGEPRPAAVALSRSSEREAEPPLRPAATSAEKTAKPVERTPRQRLAAPKRETAPPSPPPSAPAPAASPPQAPSAAPQAAPASAPTPTVAVDSAVTAVVEPVATAVSAPVEQVEEVLDLPQLPVEVEDEEATSEPLLPLPVPVPPPVTVPVPAPPPPPPPPVPPLP